MAAASSSAGAARTSAKWNAEATATVLETLQTQREALSGVSLDEEAVNLIRTLWRGERVTFEGEYYKTEKATIYDRPDVEVPIYVAAAGALVAKYAGRTGDGFICTSGKKRELYTETLVR